MTDPSGKLSGAEVAPVVMTSPPPEGTPTVQARGLSKWYGQVAGLTNLDVEVYGGIVGLLGPNGAGKTTFMRLVTGQLRPSVGEVLLFGEPVWNNPSVLKRMGYCPEHDGAWNEMSGTEFVETLCRFSGLDLESARKAASRAIGAVGMTESAHRRLGTYSKGMRQRIKLAQAIAADPDLLVLDEPLTGCDPVARASIIQLIQGLGASGKTVLVSSHVLHEVESMTEEILLINRGQLLAQGEVHALRDLIDEHPHRIRVVCDRPRDLAGMLSTHESVRSVTIGEKTLIVETDQSDLCYPEVSRAALELEVKVSEITSPDDNLEAVFKYLTSVRFGRDRS